MKTKRLLLTLMLMVASVAIFAQRSAVKPYAPTTSWPYLFEDFQKGVVVYNNDTVSMAKLNIHLRAKTLDCIDASGKVARVVLSPKFQCAIINKEVYRIVDYKPMRQVYEEEDAMLMNYTYVNYDVMDNDYKQGLALYAREKFDVTVRANWNGHINYENIPMPGEFNESYKELRETRTDGKPLHINDVYYFVLKDKVFRAIPKECNEQLDKQGQKQLKSLVKSRNLKWRNPEDLIVILQWMKGYIPQ